MFKILYQDESLVAIHKPAGMLVHRSELDVHEKRIVLQLLGEQLGLHLYPVHRLDKATSGLLVFALSAQAARGLQAQFETQAIQKTYLAIVRGYLTGVGEIDHALSEKRDQRRSKGTLSPREWPGKPAITSYEGLLTSEVPIACGRYSSSRYSLVALHPKNGRRHQLRRHLKHINHPIIGDTTYGQGTHNRLFRENFNCHRLLLSAMKLKFQHPLEGSPLEISTRLDDDFYSVMNELGWGELPDIPEYES